jgi:hypothetical protein
MTDSVESPRTNIDFCVITFNNIKVLTEQEINNLVDLVEK